MSWIAEVLREYLEQGLSLREAVERFGIEYGMNLKPIWEDIEFYIELNDVDGVARVIENFYYGYLDELSKKVEELASKVASIYAKYKYRREVLDFIKNLDDEIKKRKRELEKLRIEMKRLPKLSKEDLVKLYKLIKEVKSLEMKVKVLRSLFE